VFNLFHLDFPIDQLVHIDSGLQAGRTAGTKRKEEVKKSGSVVRAVYA
jgi:hypothetical protein